MTTEPTTADQITKACKIYAMDYDGHYPGVKAAESGSFSETPPQTSTEVFNLLITETGLGTEVIFSRKEIQKKANHLIRTASSPKTRIVLSTLEA